MQFCEVVSQGFVYKRVNNDFALFVYFCEFSALGGKLRINHKSQRIKDKSERRVKSLKSKKFNKTFS